MERHIVEIEKRITSGSSAAKRIRREGKLPCVVYSHGEQTVSGVVSMKEFHQIAKLSRTSQIFTLKSGDQGIDGKSALVKEIQKDFVAGTLLHVDFQALKENEKIVVRVPIIVKGEPVGVKLDGGILTVVGHELAIRCLPRLIPDSIELDVSPLKLGDSLHAKDIQLGEGVELEDNPEETLVSVVAPKVEEEKPAEAVSAEAGAVPAEGAVAAEGAGATAAAPAGDAKKAADGKKADTSKK